MTRGRLLSALIGTSSLLVAVLVSSPGASAAGAQSSLTVPGTPGKASVGWTGTAPFNNNQDGLVYGQLGLDDPKNSCSTSNHTPSGASFERIDAAAATGSPMSWRASKMQTRS